MLFIPKLLIIKKNILSPGKSWRRIPEENIGVNEVELFLMH